MTAARKTKHILDRCHDCLDEYPVLRQALEALEEAL
jgi:hypothetical protein